ncbi:hypothetical protein [Okeania sp. SIO2C2]|uniref:hypothetical protein n=1 Tax=Okeania sp. SIO2C2 TaxID=2607787 RepID=UPI00257DDF03|nr:hypothetical protein [Okeania sp. SIO2C2]
MKLVSMKYISYKTEKLKKPLASFWDNYIPVYFNSINFPSPPNQGKILAEESSKRLNF